MKTPTCNEIWESYVEEDDVYKSVQREIDDGWRHGNYVSEVFHRASDDTYWCVNYRVSGDGETNEFREGYGDVCRVAKTERVVTVTDYVMWKDENAEPVKAVGPS